MRREDKHFKSDLGGSVFEVGGHFALIVGSAAVEQKEGRGTASGHPFCPHHLPTSQAVMEDTAENQEREGSRGDWWPPYRRSAELLAPSARRGL